MHHVHLVIKNILLHVTVVFENYGLFGVELFIVNYIVTVHG